MMGRTIRAAVSLGLAVAMGLCVAPSSAEAGRGRVWRAQKVSRSAMKTSDRSVTSNFFYSAPVGITPGSAKRIRR